jgi:hypothetical protein
VDSDPGNSGGGTPESKLDRLIEQLRAQFASELDSRVDGIRKEYEDRLSTQASQWESQRALLLKEIQELRRKAPGADVQAEISATEAVVGASRNRTTREMERLVPDAASLGKLLQVRVEELEMKAYLRGLRFGTSKHE